MNIKRLINFLVMSVLLLVSIDTVKASQSKKSRLMEMVVSKTGFLCKIYRDYTSLITHVEIAKEDQDVYSFNLKSPYPLSFKDICSHCPWAFQEQFLNIVMTHYSINTKTKRVVVENSYEKNRIALSGVPFIDEFDVSDFMVSDEELAKIAQGIGTKKSSASFCTVEGFKLVDCAHFSKDFLTEIYYSDEEKKIRILTRKESELFEYRDLCSEEELSFNDVIIEHPYFFPEKRLGHIEKVCSFNDDGSIKNENIYPQACFKYIFFYFQLKQS